MTATLSCFCEYSESCSTIEDENFSFKHCIQSGNELGVQYKTDYGVNQETFLRTTKLKVFDNPDIVTEVVTAVIGDELVKLYTDQSNLYHSQSALN